MIFHFGDNRMNANKRIGVIHGRFQGLHNGHMEYLEAALARCDFLYIGITNYDINEKKVVNKADPNRFLNENNPFTYYERCEMIRLALLEKGYSLSRFTFVPFPIDSFYCVNTEEEVAAFKAKMFNFVPKEATYFITIYDDWGKDKYEKLTKLISKSQIDLMWTRSLDKKPISGSLVRNSIKNGKEWKDLVPNAVYQYIIENHLDERIKNTCK